MTEFWHPSNGLLYREILPTGKSIGAAASEIIRLSFEPQSDTENVMRIGRLVFKFVGGSSVLPGDLVADRVTPAGYQVSIRFKGMAPVTVVGNTASAPSKSILVARFADGQFTGYSLGDEESVTNRILGQSVYRLASAVRRIEDDLKARRDSEN